MTLAEEPQTPEADLWTSKIFSSTYASRLPRGQLDQDVGEPGVVLPLLPESPFLLGHVHLANRRVYDLSLIITSFSRLAFQLSQVK